MRFEKYLYGYKDFWIKEWYIRRKIKEFIYRWFFDILNFHLDLLFFLIDIRLLTRCDYNFRYYILALQIKIFKWDFRFELGETKKHRESFNYKES